MMLLLMDAGHSWRVQSGLAILSDPNGAVCRAPGQRIFPAVGLSGPRGGLSRPATASMITGKSRSLV